MNKIDELLEYVRKSNPGMTKDRLLEELEVSRYATKSLLYTMAQMRKDPIKIQALSNYPMMNVEIIPAISSVN